MMLYNKDERVIDLNVYTHRCKCCYQEYGTHHKHCIELAKYQLEDLIVSIYSKDSEWLSWKLKSTLKQIERNKDQIMMLYCRNDKGTLSIAETDATPDMLVDQEFFIGEIGKETGMKMIAPVLGVIESKGDDE